MIFLGYNQIFRKGEKNMGPYIRQARYGGRNYRVVRGGRILPGRGGRGGSRSGRGGAGGTQP